MHFRSPLQALSLASLLALSLVTATPPSSSPISPPSTGLQVEVDICAYIDISINVGAKIISDILDIEFEVVIDIKECLCLEALVAFCTERARSRGLSATQQANLLAGLASTVSHSYGSFTIRAECNVDSHFDSFKDLADQARPAHIPQPQAVHRCARLQTSADSLVPLAIHRPPTALETQPVYAHRQISGAAMDNASPKIPRAPAHLRARRDACRIQRSRGAPVASPSVAYMAAEQTHGSVSTPLRISRAAEDARFLTDQLVSLVGTAPRSLT
ncbi:hypothetical protein FRB97_004537 [Tulasnella sp. 331]|nr:hypothetical protein FRB97_004537 [Tulasnella sp. 331]